MATISPHDSIKELHSKIGGEYEKTEDTVASKNNKLKSCESSWETIFVRKIGCFCLLLQKINKKKLTT